MKIGLFNVHNSYLFYDLTEALTLNGHEVAVACMRSMPQGQVDIMAVIEDVNSCREKLQDCDYVILVNYDPFYETAKIYPPERTCCLYFDPPGHFPSPKNIGMCLQMLKVGPHKKIEWGVMERFFKPQNSDILYGGAAFMRLYLDQADNVFRMGNIPVAQNFYAAAYERIAGVKLCQKIAPLQPFVVFGGKDYSKFGINTVMNKHEDIHMFMAQTANIVDHCRQEIGENPKYLYACAMNKPFYNIQTNTQTNQIEIVRKAWRKPRTTKEFGEEIIDLITSELGRNKTQFVGADVSQETISEVGNIIKELSESEAISGSVLE